MAFMPGRTRSSSSFARHSVKPPALHGQGTGEGGDTSRRINTAIIQSHPAGRDRPGPANRRIPLSS